MSVTQTTAVEVKTEALEAPGCAATAREDRPTGPHWLVLAGLALTGVVLAILVVVSSNLLASPQDPAAPPEASPLYVNTLAVSQIDSPRVSRTFAGIVKARRDSELGFDRAGRLLRVLVREGDKVQTGDPLAELDKEGLKNRKAKFDEALSKQAREALSATEKAPPATPAEMQQSIQQLRVELNQLQTQSTQQQPAQTFQAMQQRLLAAEARVRSLEQQFRGPSPATASARGAELETQRALLEIQLKQSTLVAPFDGVIAARYLDEGSGVAPGRPVVRILEEAFMEASFRLPTDAADRLKSGDPQTLKIANQEVTGTVATKSPQLDPTARTRTVTIELPDTLLDVLPGQMARMTVDVPVDDVGFWLPLAALTRGVRGLWSVYAVETDGDGTQRVAARFVEVLFLVDNQAFVRGTLQGQQVISDGTHRIVPGQRVLMRDTPPTDTPVPSPGQ